MQRHEAVEIRASQVLFRGRVFDLVRETVALPSGLVQELDVVDHPGAVCIAPLLADGRLLVVRQYRHAAGAWLEELPAGRLDPGEEPLAAAQRELEEETGHRARSWTLLRTFFAAPGFCSERMHVFVARELEPIQGGGRAADPDEELELVERSTEELLRSACDAKTLLTAALLALGAADDGTRSRSTR